MYVKYFIQKILLSIMSLAFFCSIFGTVTYAWFSLHKQNQLSNLGIELITGDEFQISLDGINFSSEIKTEEIERFIGGKARLVDVTSFDGETFSFGILNEDRGIPEPNKDYLSFPLYFRTTLRQKYVYLVDNVSSLVQYDMVRDGTYVVSRGVVWRADTTFLNGPDPAKDLVLPGNRLTMYASEAVRVGIVEEKVDWNHLDERNPFELHKKIFDLSGNQERGYGFPYGGISYFNSKHRDRLTPPEERPMTVYQLSAFDEEYNPYVALTRDSEILEMVKTELLDEKGNPYYVGKVIVNIWLEGWDADCFNAIFADSIRIRLKFRSGNPIMQPHQPVINLKN